MNTINGSIFVNQSHKKTKTNIEKIEMQNEMKQMRTDQSKTNRTFQNECNVNKKRKTETFTSCSPILAP